jgi:SagB-type dehydrogenase family enzyme
MSGPNADVSAAWAYHDATKHSPASVRASRHTLDWDNQPLPFKIYTSTDKLPLPRESAGPASGSPGTGGLDRTLLARLCLYANGVTRTVRWSGGEMPFRAAACTGALYHVELYLVCGPLPDVEAGVYHYAAHDHSLGLLRRGDFRSVLVEATGAEAGVARAPAVGVCTSTFWRNAWKYQARAYRHSFWDTGTVVANLLSVAAAHDVAARLALGFVDETVNRLLDVDPAREVAICLVALGDASDAVLPPAEPVEPLGLPTRRLSAHEVDYPEIRAMHVASSLESGEEVAAWRPGAGSLGAAPFVTREPIEDVIRRRGSSRRFTHAAIERGQLSTMLELASHPIDSDVQAAGPLSQPYLIFNAVDGLEPGAYVLDRATGGLEPLRLGSFRQIAGFLDLGQDLAADAAANVYWLSDLSAVLGRLGNRGYRAAQLEAAIQAGRLYLAAYALNLGATGLTFFDDEVIRCFSPHAVGKSVLFLMAVGHPARRPL